MSPPRPVVFVSSTCRDLTDARQELSDRLAGAGFDPRLSDDLDSGFRVDPSLKTIETCLQNLLGSNIVLFIFDRLYGDGLGGKYGDRSATRVEYEAARQANMKRHTFIRKRTMQEYGEWVKYGDAFRREYVEDAQHRDLFGLIKEVKDPHDPVAGSNWYDLFESSLDLWKAAQKRLSDDFGLVSPARGLSTDRAVRLGFKVLGSGVSQKRANVRFMVTNHGPSVADRIKVFLAHDGKQTGELKNLAPLPVGGQSDLCLLELPWDGSGKDLKIVCEYENLQGDRFEVRVPLKQKAKGSPYRSAPEEFRAVRSD